ncbi:MAG TPA: hypothetical protein VIM00_14400, partial [Candidatus Acidoferrum sp.]
HARTPTEDDWRRRLLAVASRGARSISSGSISSATDSDYSLFSVDTNNTIGAPKDADAPAVPEAP